MELLPQPLQQLAAQPRIHIRRGGALRRDGHCVVYWMQRAQRVLDNPALDTAIHVGNELGLPVVVYFSIVANYPDANLRHYHFMAQGLRDVEQDLAERNVGFVVRRAPEHSLESFLEEVGAVLLVGDENPCREPERWRQVLARKLRIPFWTVDADVLVPTAHFQKHYYMLHHFRSKLYAYLPEELAAPSSPRPAKPWKPDRNPVHYDLRGNITEGLCSLDRSVAPVETFHGGAHAAGKRLHFFVKHLLGEYAVKRNHPEEDGSSCLSPYLHFGHLGPLTLARAVENAYAKGEIPRQSRDAFLNEAIGWRELAVNFVRHVPHYDSLACAPAWAERTLAEHATDVRNPRYSLAQLEQAETHDELWNAAQRQMVHTGWMHNVLRMYWAKKILEWTYNPAQAYEFALLLNDRYQLDGRDPNGYAGIAWAIAGVHDRPWFERPIFGTIRYMSGASTGKKFHSRLYIQQHS